MTDVVFEELPDMPKSRWNPRAKHTDVVRQLRTRPGQWARVCTLPTRSGAGALAHQIRTGVVLAYTPVGAFEAVSRTVDGEFRVYARYSGGATP